ncbi:MAG: hypothetical protein IID63_07730 [candidate division Zixibacteria bacterium]|nr:hypothetical protein [candidate division Zixibacteria bacterium]
MVNGYFYSTFSSDPFYNMAMDEWLFARAAAEPETVFVRLYSWSPGAITIGLNQDIDRAVDLSKLNGISVIRRITGGRALYHDPGELTYAIAAKASSASFGILGSSIQETSGLIASALAGFLEDIGIATQIVRQSSPGFKEKDGFNKLSCFKSAARYEIVSNGRKIVGSAQRRINDTFLQHGSIKLAKQAEHPALSKKAECEPEPDETQWIMGENLSDISESFSRNLAGTLGISLSSRTLCEQEEKAIESSTKFLMKNPLMKRNLIKHSDPVVSL